MIADQVIGCAKALWSNRLFDKYAPIFGLGFNGWFLMKFNRYVLVVGNKCNVQVDYKHFDAHFKVLFPVYTR